MERPEGRSGGAVSGRKALPRETVPRELVIISGKGGTGKTSLSAAFAALEKEAVLADCDVDAADLHLVLAPTQRRREDFSGGNRAVVSPDLCTGCGTCADVCRFGAVGPAAAGGAFAVDPLACEGCGVCARFCPAKAVRLEEAHNGEWYVSDTRSGPLVHARLGVGEENSGKLVALVRREARALAEKEGRDLILADGPPGIGCPVIASLSGADLAVIVTEPTVAAEHDLERVAALAAHFGVPVLVCVNKADLNPETAARIEAASRDAGRGFAGRLSYDRAYTDAQRRGRSVVETGDGRAAVEVRDLWQTIRRRLFEPVRGPAPVISAVGIEAGAPNARTKTMKIALPVAQGQLCMHFGHCETFALVEVNPDSREILGTTFLVPPPHEPGVLPKWLSEQGANLVIAGGMGMRAQQFFGQYGVQVVVGASPAPPEEIARAYLDGSLVTGGNVCDH